MKTVSLDLAKLLKQNNFPQESYFFWQEYQRQDLQKINPTKIITAEESKKHRRVVKSYIQWYAAPTAEEILDLLPVYVQFENKSLPFAFRIEKEIGGDFPDEYVVVYVRYSKTIHSEKDYQERGRTTNESLAEAAGLMYLYLAENGLLEKGKI